MPIWKKFTAKLSKPMTGGKMIEGFKAAGQELDYRVREVEYEKSTYCYPIREAASQVKGDELTLVSCDNYNGGIKEFFNVTKGVQDIVMVVSPNEEYREIQILHYTENEIVGFESKKRRESFEKKFENFKLKLSESCGTEFTDEVIF